MADLRARLHAAGWPDAETYVQSGNVVLRSELPPAELAAELRARLRAWFELDVPIVTRTAEELAAVLAADPLAAVADEPKRYVVTFLDREPDPEAVARVAQTAADGEQIVAREREIYTWHPHGQGRSKLSLALAGAQLGATATARNWRTVTALHGMATA